MPDSTFDTKIIDADDVTHIVRYPGSSKEMLRRRTVRAIESVNNYEKLWKIKTNTNKFQIINISKKRPLDKEIDGTPINFTKSGILLGMKLSTTGLTQFANKKIQKAKQELFKLKHFSKFNAKKNSVYTRHSCNLTLIMPLFLQMFFCYKHTQITENTK